MKREDGILEVALHSGGGPLVFNGYVHEALVGAFRDIGDDRENHVVILTGPAMNSAPRSLRMVSTSSHPPDTTRSSGRARRGSRTCSTYRSRSSRRSTCARRFIPYLP